MAIDCSLAGSAVGLLASTLGRLYSSTYYALGDTRTPLNCAIVRVALTTVLGNQEARNRFYTDYYTQFLARVPTAAELTSQEAFYQSNVVTLAPNVTQTKRLESVVANILRTNEYFPLSGPGSANSTWLDKIYQALLGRSKRRRRGCGKPERTRTPE